MNVDPASLDPELRFSRLYAIASAAIGVISLCMGVIPICGVSAGLAGVILGILSLRTENTKTAMAGIAISSVGVFAALIYVIGVVYFGK